MPTFSTSFAFLAGIFYLELVAIFLDFGFL